MTGSHKTGTSYNMQVELIRFRKIYRLHSHLRSEEFNATDVFKLGKSLQHKPVRYLITLIIRDMSPSAVLCTKFARKVVHTCMWLCIVRRACLSLLFQGLTWNGLAGEHSRVQVPPCGILFHWCYEQSKTLNVSGGTWNPIFLSRLLCNCVYITIYI